MKLWYNRIIGGEDMSLIIFLIIGASLVHLLCDDHDPHWHGNVYRGDDDE